MQEYAITCAEIRDRREVRHALLRTARQQALLNILRQLQETYSAIVPELDEPLAVLVLEYFNGGPLRQQVIKILGIFGLDELAIEAQAFKEEMPALEAIEKIIASLETRRDRILAVLAALRESFADRSRQTITPVIEDARNVTKNQADK